MSNMCGVHFLFFAARLFSSVLNAQCVHNGSSFFFFSGQCKVISPHSSFVSPVPKSPRKKKLANGEVISFSYFLSKTSGNTQWLSFWRMLVTLLLRRTVFLLQCLSVSLGGKGKEHQQNKQEVSKGPCLQNEWVISPLCNLFSSKKRGWTKKILHTQKKRQQKIMVAHNTPFPPFQRVGTTTSSQIKKAFLGCQKKGILRRRK